VVRRYVAGEGINSIAADLHLGGVTVHGDLVRRGVERRRPATPRRVQVDVAVALYQQGLTRVQIAAELRCTGVTARRRLHEARTHLVRLEVTDQRRPCAMSAAAARMVC
jgi:hypothetical protein